jgi:hypothetical protein
MRLGKDGEAHLLSPLMTAFWPVPLASMCMKRRAYVEYRWGNDSKGVVEQRVAVMGPYRLIGYPVSMGKVEVNMAEVHAHLMPTQSQWILVAEDLTKLFWGQQCGLWALGISCSHLSPYSTSAAMLAVSKPVC